MTPVRGRFAAILLAMPVLAGCLGGVDGPDDGPPTDGSPCQHPAPCGDEWPEGLEGPFELRPVEALRVASHDGVGLETYLYRPDIPDDVRLPAVLWSQPYAGGCAFNAVLATGGCVPAGDSDFVRDGGMRVDVRRLVESGYVVVVSNVRGTGNSGGCFSFGGLAEQEDQVALVEWIAGQEWSSGRVAMYGHSYHGYTPWMAANRAPEALKTIVASGILTDPYTFYHTPQGAPAATGGAFQAGMSVTQNTVPPLGGGAQHATTGHVGVLPERACPGFADTLGEAGRSQFSDDRNGPWWQERRLIEDFDKITAAVLVSHGLNDDTGHAFQEDVVWSALTNAPKRFILGQWGHDLPPPETLLADAPFGGDWHADVLLPWFDYWLKGIGGPDRLGAVSYQVQDGSWRETPRWPPTEVREEVLYLTSQGLAPQAQGGSKTFHASVPPVDAACLPAESAATEDSQHWVVYTTQPLQAPATVAGNPFAFLQLTSNLPGGLVSVDLFDFGPEGACEDVTWVAGGAADLRFHQGGFQGNDFPINEPTAVRVDVLNDAWTFETDHRVAVIVSGMGWRASAGQPFAPLVTVHADESHIVLPVLEGTLGGDVPSIDYPPRPFVPERVTVEAG